jgi:hypothetical protein
MQIPAIVLVTIYAAVEAPWVFLVAFMAWLTWQAVKEPVPATD